MDINLHIERLVLDGIKLNHYQRRQLQASVQTELARLLIDGGLASSFMQGVAMPKLNANAIQTRGNDATQLGQQIAQSVYGGISHE
jgi:hypothetical protein